MPPVCARCQRPHYANQPCPASRAAAPPPRAGESVWRYGGRCGYTPNQGRFKGRSCISPPHSVHEHHRYEDATDPTAEARARAREILGDAEDTRRAPAPPPARDPEAQARQNVEAIRRRPAPPPPPAPDPAPAPPPADDSVVRFQLLDLEPATARPAASPTGDDDSAARFRLLELD